MIEAKKIVVIDGHTLNPGDLEWAPLTSLGSCTIHDRSAAEEVLSRCRGAAIVITNKVPFGRPLFQQLPGLRYVGITATGYNIVDIEAARAHEVIVTNVPAYSTLSVAQHTFALLLETTHHAGAHSDGVRRGRWSAAEDFCYWDFPLIELQDKTLGIIGLGRIGQAVARIGAAFGMRILAYDVQAPLSVAEIEMCATLEEIFVRSDVVTLHCPLTPQTHHLVNAWRLALMRPHAILLNTSRGPLIDEAALVEALHHGRIAAAALDVLSEEPPPADHPLLLAPNALITPHIAWATRAARQRLLDETAANVAAFLAGQPRNVVSG